jgi:hypothetical protein
MRPDEELEAFHAVINRAYSDDRTAIDELQVIAETPMHRFRNRASGVVDNITRLIINSPQNPALIERLQKLSYAELLQYYRETPQHRAFVLIAVRDHTLMTEDEKARFMALMIEDRSFRVAQRACLYIGIGSYLDRYEQVQPTAYKWVIRKCRVYGKAWENLSSYTINSRSP